jgi:hypothetical protein
MTCNNGPNKVINDFNIFLGIDITVNKCTHTFVGDAAQIIKLTRALRPGFKHDGVHSVPGSSANKYVVVHFQFYLIFITINHLLPEIIYCFVPFQFTPWPSFFDIVVANSDTFFYNTLVIFFFKQFSLNSSIRYRSNTILVYISNFLEWTFFVRFYNPI